MLNFDRLQVKLPGSDRRAGAPGMAVVRELSFSVGAGETVGLVGESGCGKTMAAMAAIGLLPEGAKASGSIRLGSQELIGAPETLLRQLRGRKIAMVFQNPMTALNPYFSVQAHLDAVIRAHRSEPAATQRARADRALDRVALASGIAERYPHQLSGGQLQRVVVALAVACEPKVLIADEPTTALDVTLQAHLMALLQSLTETGMGLLLITHDLALVSQVADRVVVMYAGETVEVGSAARVLGQPAHPYTQALLGAQPRLGMVRVRLASIPGRVPAPEDATPGCAFALRCQRAEAICQRESAPLRGAGPGHTARCHFVAPEALPIATPAAHGEAAHGEAA